MELLNSVKLRFHQNEIKDFLESQVGKQNLRIGEIVIAESSYEAGNNVGLEVDSFHFIVFNVP